MDKLINLIKREFSIRVVEESLPRIIKCLNHLDEKQLWHTTNSNTNSVGNLILHLAGNVRQYILAGLGDHQDMRRREEEFLPHQNIKKKELEEKINETLITANAIVQEIDSNAFTKEIKVQGFDHTGISIIVHVIEHLSYHVGQITHITKALEDIDLAYYGGLDLDVTS